jgi:hypothetical protein
VISRTQTVNRRRTVESGIGDAAGRCGGWDCPILPDIEFDQSDKRGDDQ